MGRPRCLFGLQQVFGEPFQHLLLQQEFIHDEKSASRTSGGQVLIMKGSTSSPRRFCSLQVNFSDGHRPVAHFRASNGRNWPTAGGHERPLVGYETRGAEACLSDSSGEPRMAAEDRQRPVEKKRGSRP
jgi:hypothetical protein